MKHLFAAFAAVLALAGAVSARADNYTAKDGSTPQVSLTFCSKTAAGVQHPCHVMEGVTSAGQPDALLTDGAGHLLPSADAPTATAQATGNGSLASIAASTKPVTSFGAVKVGSAFTPGLGIAAVCTAAGNVVLAGANGSQITVPVGVGFNQFGFAVAEVVSQTATCTFTALS